jgi:hypothetical protein
MWDAQPFARRMKMRRLIPALLAGLVLSATACGGGDSSGPASIAGTYTLQTVNNAPLPFTTSEDATYKAEILSWVVTLNDNNTYSHVFRGRSTDNGYLPRTRSRGGLYPAIYALDRSAVSDSPDCLPDWRTPADVRGSSGPDAEKRIPLHSCGSGIRASNGRGGIRTHGTLLTYTHFPVM